MNDKKPPTGVMPDVIWREKRVAELIRAIGEYLSGGFYDDYRITVDGWIKELGSHMGIGFNLGIHKRLRAGWTMSPCSCACGGQWTWMRPRRSGAFETAGCVCHGTKETFA